MLENTFLSYCWACKNVFNAELLEHRHHIVPRAFGGVDGPQVSLCDTDHAILHKIALRLIAEKPFFDLLTKNQARDKHILYLAMIVANAKIATDNDPNKAQVVVLHLTKEYKDKLNELKQVMGKMSRQRLIEYAVDNLHNKFFITKK